MRETETSFSLSLSARMSGEEEAGGVGTEGSDYVILVLVLACLLLLLTITFILCCLTRTMLPAASVGTKARSGPQAEGINLQRDSQTQTSVGSQRVGL